MRIGFCSAIVAVLFAGYSSAGVYYVSVTGDDANPGTQDAPFRRISRAVSAATQPGDTVIVMDGTYDNEGVVAPHYVVNLVNSGAPGLPINIMAQNRGQAILDSNASSSLSCDGASAYFNLGDASYIVIQGFVIQRACDEGIHSNGNAHDITIRWNEFKNIGNHTVVDEFGRDGIFMNGNQYNFTFDGNTFHDIGRTGGTPRLHFDHAIYSHARNVMVVNNLFYNMNRGWSVQLADGASNWLIANNTFAFRNANGEPGQIMFWGNNSNITIQNNIFYQPARFALNQYAAAISSSFFDHNLVYGPDLLMAPSILGIAIGTNQTGADPMFVNATTPPYDFHPQWNSPAAGTGVTIFSPSADLNGAIRGIGAPTDLGAFVPVPLLELIPLVDILRLRSGRSEILNRSSEQTPSRPKQPSPGLAQ